MSRTKGYHSYRGRASKLKILLAVVLCLVILAALTVLYLQEHMIYDENGVKHLTIPWLQEEPEDKDTPDPDAPPEEEPVLDLVIQEPPGPPPMHAFSLPAGPLTVESWEQKRMGAPSAPPCPMTRRR